MNLFFSDTDSDQNPANVNNWWDGTGRTGSNGYTPTVYDVCEIDPSQTCSTSNFDFFSLKVYGTLTNNVSGKVILEVVAGGTVTTNLGTITTNSGTVADNQWLVGVNYGAITTRTSGGTTTSEFQAADIPSGYTVTYLSTSIDTNSGTIGEIQSSRIVTTNYGGITTNNGYVDANYSTIAHNYNAVNVNHPGATITTNESTGNVADHRATATIGNNLGNVRLGTITTGSGTLSAANVTNLSSHTAGANVTLPSGNTTWW